MLPDSFFQQAQEVWPVVHVVGGFLRERWFGKLSQDLDLLVPHSAILGAAKLARALNKPWFVLDSERDIARIAFSSSLTIDIAAYSDSDLDSDLCARDLTMNAIACPLVSELISLEIAFENLPYLDPCGGVEDLNSHLIRGISLQNFKSDPLRLLRVFRFAACYGFEIDVQTLEWVSRYVHLILKVAPERILQELDKMLKGPFLFSAFKSMIETKLVYYIFIELNDLQDDQWTKMVAVWSDFDSFGYLSLLKELPLIYQKQLAIYLTESITGSRNRRDILILASFFQLKQLELWSEFAKRIRLSVKEAEFGLNFLKLRALFADFKNNYLDKLQRFRFYRKAQYLLPGLLISALLFRELDLQDATDNEFVNVILKEYFDTECPLLKRPALLNGQDLQNHLNLKPGPLIGQLLLTVQEAQVLDLINSKAEALSYAEKLLANNCE
jgi:tRNA nucleotidyltransferase/poly(A) polymerase